VLIIGSYFRHGRFCKLSPKGLLWQNCLDFTLLKALSLFSCKIALAGDKQATLPMHRTLIRIFGSFLTAMLVFGFLALQSIPLRANPVKKAYQLIRKGTLPEAREVIEKARRKGKDDFGLDYVQSHYYLSPYQKTLSLDSAYRFCLMAIDKYRTESIQGKKRYEKLGIDHLRIDSAELFSRKDYLDSLGFSKAQNLESESAYQWFLDNFPKSTRLDKAQGKRASLAFARAKEENSYQAFALFLENFPNAKEAVEAREIRELLEYQTAANNGKLADWEDFIGKNPNNQYVVKAQEKIYEISTRLHNPDAYFQFIRKYPENPNVSKAWEWIYFLEDPGLTLKQVSAKYPGFPEENFELQQRLRSMPLIPFTELGKFGWMDFKGHHIIRPRLDSISEDARCELGNLQFLKAFQKKKAVVFCLDSFPATEGEYDDAELFQKGVLKVFKKGKEGLYHMGGYPILDARFEKISVLNQNLLVIQQGSKQSVFTAKGNKVDLPGVDEIIPAGNYLALRNGSKFALLTEGEILRSLENEDLKPEYRYRSIKPLSANHLLLIEGEDSYLLSNNKTSSLKTTKGTNVKPCAWGIQLERSGLVSMIDTNGQSIGGDFERVLISGNMAVVKANGKFGLMNRSAKLVRPFQYDSLSPFSPGIFHAWKGGKRFMLFDSGREISFSGNRSPEILRFLDSGENPKMSFICLSDSIGRKAVFSSSGQQILSYSWTQVNLAEPHFFILEAERKFGLADTSGNILLKPVYTGISSINGEYVCVAKGKQISILNPHKQKVLLGKLSSTARSFGPSRNLFVVRLQDKAGIIDQNGKQLVPFHYEDVLYWNPTKCLVKKNGFWYFFVLNSGKELVKAIKKVHLLLERDGELIYEVESDGKSGLESTLRGEIASTTNDQIVLFEHPTGVCFFLGSRVQNSSVYNVKYIDLNGTLIKTQLLTEDEYEGILCE